jgi:hypothetical protein
LFAAMSSLRLAGWRLQLGIVCAANLATSTALYTHECRGSWSYALRGIAALSAGPLVVVFDRHAPFGPIVDTVAALALLLSPLGALSYFWYRTSGWLANLLAACTGMYWVFVAYWGLFIAYS